MTAWKERRLATVGGNEEKAASTEQPCEGRVLGTSLVVVRPG